MERFNGLHFKNKADSFRVMGCIYQKHFFDCVDSSINNNIQIAALLGLFQVLNSYFFKDSYAQCTHTHTRTRTLFVPLEYWFPFESLGSKANFILCAKVCENKVREEEKKRQPF